MDRRVGLSTSVFTEKKTTEQKINSGSKIVGFVAPKWRRFHCFDGEFKDRIANVVCNSCRALYGADMLVFRCFTPILRP